MTGWPQGGSHSPSHPCRCWCETQADKRGAITAPQPFLPLAVITSTKVGSSMAKASVAGEQGGHPEAHRLSSLWLFVLLPPLWLLQEVITL